MNSAVKTALKPISIALYSVALSPVASAVDLINLGDFPDWFKTSMVRETNVSETSEFELTALSAKGNCTR